MKLQLREDSTIAVPLQGPGDVTAIVLREPGLRSLGEINDLAVEADKAWADSDVADRGRLQFSPDSPYLQVFMEIIRRLGDYPGDPQELLDSDRLPAWSGQATTISTIVRFFTIPLDGAGVSRLLPQN